jgi:hypothetical protein
MWLCCQQPWRWLALLKLASASVWAVDDKQTTFYGLGQAQTLQMSQPRWVFVTPWWVAFYFTRVQRGHVRIAPRWWICCGSWTDATAFSRCRRMALFWREHRR